ncbi:MAG: hypothetical protein IPJ65_33580 [Archangiaceae bacterium]|nr:hypothetical protein [Archangiaceae bacterium]
MGSTRGAGDGCRTLNQAYSARTINVGYYPYRVKAPLPQYSGDVGGSNKGVLLQTVPVGAYVGLASDGPWYDPPSGSCFPTGFACGSPTRSACPDNSPPLRPTRAGFAWGYAYDGASHMQGWFPFDPNLLEFVGFTSHPCALGPAGADYEVESACGQPLAACSGGNTTCHATNRCDEGGDDCGSVSCGASSGGPWTPTAHRLTLASPGGHTCTQRTPPLAGVKCLANGSDPDFFFVYPFGAYLYWAQNSTTKHWLHYGDRVQVYFTNVDAQGVRWYFVEVLQSGAPVLTPPSDGSGAGGACDLDHPESCTPCKNGGACGWVQSVFFN